MTDFEKSILKIVSESPGIKAREIAAKLEVDKKEVNSILFNALSARCYQDEEYRWFIQGENQNSDLNGQDIAQPDELLHNVCKYYLNCLSLEENNGVSAFLKSQFSLNYTELSSLSINGDDDKVANLLKKVSSERNLTSYVGYPIMIERLHSTKNNQDYLRLAPVFLFPVDIVGGAADVAQIPSVNIEVIKQYSSKDINSQVYDLVELEKELGLNNPEIDIEIDELVSRLQSIRQWQWQEELEPSNLSSDIPIEDIVEEGVYNRAVLIVSERSPYTIGLEAELSQLMTANEDAYRNTALYDWLHGNVFPNNEDTLDNPLLEVLPLNSEQEYAIRHAMNENLTIVTGPPGTGKSQVVTDLLINTAWNGGNALFTSKNNKAVDVVEKRVNGLSKRPIMLRIGGNQYAYHLAELISELLSYTADQNDQAEYAEYDKLYKEKVTTYQLLKRQKESVIRQRNTVDRLEQKVCDLRGKWGCWVGKISSDDVRNLSYAFENLKSVKEEWERKRLSFFGKLFWSFIGGKETTALEQQIATLNVHLEKLSIGSLTISTVLDTARFDKYCIEISNAINSLQVISEYSEALYELEKSEPTECIDKQLFELKQELADIASNLWNKWLVTRPLEMDSACRTEMNEYVSAMKLIGDVDLQDYPEQNKQFKKLQKKMTNFLPCWAVTSLSAKGKIPFQPGLFDLVVIDEASQCDIASVLPMLYRAKRAVIIGDPKQLSHISTISKAQDVSLLNKYRVSMGWSYSVNSLYAIGSSIAEPSMIIQLRDHHRSFADIIEFSNSEFYDGKLRVATNYDRLKCPENTNAGIRWINVVGNTIRPSNGGAYNDTEVDEIVNEIKRLVIDNDYHGSVGVVTPFRAQAEKIRKVIEDKPELYNYLSTNNEFQVDTVHKFQGDERDVMIFSPVISVGTSSGALGFLNNTGNLFNVAITRARAILVVVGDMNYCAHSGVSYMEHFVEYVNKQKEPAEPIDSIQNRTYPVVSNPEQVSDWERVFYTALYDAGIKTIPQYPADKYKLDLAIVQGHRKLDIEIDGEMYHKNWNGELCYRDQLRNQRLFELGWDVKRFWVYQIRDEMPKCIEQIRQWVDSAT